MHAPRVARQLDQRLAGLEQSLLQLAQQAQRRRQEQQELAYRPPAAGARGEMVAAEGAGAARGVKGAEGVGLAAGSAEGAQGAERGGGVDDSVSAADQGQGVEPKHLQEGVQGRGMDSLNSDLQLLGHSVAHAWSPPLVHHSSPLPPGHAPGPLSP